MFEITVIIPTYNRLDRLQRVLAALAKQNYASDRFEVIVVSDGSTDGTLEYLANVRLPFQIFALSQQNQGAAAARNRGIEAAQGDLVLFLDDDVMPTATLITEHMHSHHHAGADTVVLGPMLTPTDFAMAPWVQWEQAMLIKQYNEMSAGDWQPTARQFYTGNASVARQHLITVEGFDCSFRRAEDVELAYRLSDRGVNFLFNPNAIGYHYAERRFSAWLNTPYEYGRNDVTFAQKRGQSWLLQTVAKEFHARHQMIRALVFASLSRPRIAYSARQGLRAMAMLAARLGHEAIANYAYSGIFNLQYYQGMADALGGRQLFWEMIYTQANTRASAGWQWPRGQVAEEGPHVD